jgi:hypothetical protein
MVRGYPRRYTRGSLRSVRNDVRFRDPLHRRRSRLPHHDFDLLAQNRKHRLDALLAERRESPDVRPSDSSRGRPERQRFEDPQCAGGSLLRATGSKSNTSNASAGDAMRSGSCDACCSSARPFARSRELPPSKRRSDTTSMPTTLRSGLPAANAMNRRRESGSMCIVMMDSRVNGH